MRAFAAGLAALLLGWQPVLAQGGGVVETMEGKPVLGIRHVAITVSDIDATIAFYAQAVPYKVERRFRVKASAFGRKLLTAPAGEVEIALVQMPTMWIQLMDVAPGTPVAPNPRPVIGPGYTHICFQSPATSSAETRFRAAGLRMVSRGDAPVDIGGYGVRYSYGRDPDGIMIENEVLDAPRRSEPAWVTHVANVVHDRERMLAFYEKLLGVAPHRRLEQENRPKLDAIADIDGLSIRGGWLRLGNMELEVWEYARPRTPAPGAPRMLDEIGYNAIGFEVADMKAARARLKALKVPLVGPVVRQDGWAVQHARDPEGNLFSLVANLSGDPALSVTRLPPPRAPAS
jgi:catechol 2,3-dioxygenase-like lactoylglutathione lyase family enzyme